MLSANTFFQIAGVIFSIVGILHLLRLLTGFQVVLGGWVTGTLKIDTDSSSGLG